MGAPMFYEKPAGRGSLLHVAPAPASWDAAGSPSQIRSADFIDDVHDLAAEKMAALPDPLSLLLDVGLPDAVPLLERHDLDNYLFPLVPQLTKRTGRQFVSVWATKRHATSSSVLVGTAVPTTDPGGTYSFDVETTPAADTTAYKEQIRDQVSAATPLGGAGVALQIAFVVGPRRSWPNLWKATIDSLGPILGRDDGAGEWNIRDGRVTHLGLHSAVNPEQGNEVRITLRVSSAAAGE
ncbi:hypothetical protein [Spelaeicoccus albus]|uniref:Uncharacterized protein n=1 Tax=Spelaeicoccus albus TaxID=1280376 RepID=A0A7Z0A7Z5_9MICO|nr:hypothetical protein [Spelaeicoccus albus]NYI66112.1 hypothetical protein [Spelaeicoccus albus]